MNRVTKSIHTLCHSARCNVPNAQRLYRPPNPWQDTLLSISVYGRHKQSAADGSLLDFQGQSGCCGLLLTAVRCGTIAEWPLAAGGRTAMCRRLHTVRHIACLSAIDVRCLPHGTLQNAM